MRKDRFLGQINDQFTLKNIGSTLLEELAERLYQPQEVIREYIQNAVDAHRKWKSESDEEPDGPIQVLVRTDQLSVLDYGVGLDEEGMKEVKSIAVSKKRSSEYKQTGHKGVGIWAGLSFFKKLVIYSTKRDIDRGYELTIEFDNIKTAIGEDRDIGSVLNPNYQISEYSEEKGEHYTHVSLIRKENTSDPFFDPDFMKAVVRQICPCELDETFVYADRIKSWYSENGIEMFQIEVENDQVFRSYPSNVESIKFGEITINDKCVAKYWYAINSWTFAKRLEGLCSQKSGSMGT